MARIEMDWKLRFWQTLAIFFKYTSKPRVTMALGEAGSCQANNHSLLQDHHFLRNMERMNHDSTGGHCGEELQSLNLRNK